MWTVVQFVFDSFENNKCLTDVSTFYISLCVSFHFSCSITITWLHLHVLCSSIYVNTSNNNNIISWPSRWTANNIFFFAKVGHRQKQAWHHQTHCKIWINLEALSSTSTEQNVCGCKSMDQQLIRARSTELVNMTAEQLKAQMKS